MSEYVKTDDVQVSDEYIYVKHECGRCRGTGLYSGFAEPKGTAVICRGCGGLGIVETKVKRFKGRKKMRGIKTISESRGSFIATGVGPREGTDMTYAEFEKKFPQR